MGKNIGSNCPQTSPCFKPVRVRPRDLHLNLHTLRCFMALDSLGQKTISKFLSDSKEYNQSNKQEDCEGF